MTAATECHGLPNPRAQSNALALASISEFTQLLSCTSRAINILSNMCLILNMQESVSLVSICLKLQTMSYKKVLNTFVIFTYLISAICFCWGNTGNEVFHTFLWSFDCLAPTIRPAANHHPQIVLLILLTYTYPFCLLCNYISADSTSSFICANQSCWPKYLLPVFECHSSIRELSVLPKELLWIKEHQVYDLSLLKEWMKKRWYL